MPFLPPSKDEFCQCSTGTIIKNKPNEFVIVLFLCSVIYLALAVVEPAVTVISTLLSLGGVFPVSLLSFGRGPQQRACASFVRFWQLRDDLI